VNLLPHNHAIEVAVLGALLVDTDLAGVGELMDRMHVDLFHREHHAAVFSAMRAQWAESGIVDYRGVEARLRAERAHDHPADLLRQIAEQAAVLPAAAAYVGDLTDLHRRRRLIAQAERSAREAADLSAPVSGIVDNLLAGVSDSMDTGRRSSSSTRAESIRSHVEAIRSGAVDHGMDTGFHELDRIIGGMRRGHLLIVAARPSMGKSAFCLDVAVNATKASIPVAFFSLEMSSSDIAERLLAKSLRYSTDHLHTIPADDLAQLEQLDDAVSRAEADDDRAG
jgi:replicative DNA helicase